MVDATDIMRASIVGAASTEEAVQNMGAGLLLSDGRLLDLTNLQFVSAQVMLGQAGLPELADAVSAAATYGPLYRELDPGMRAGFPFVRYGGQVFAWADACLSPRTMLWYILAADSADSARLAAAVSGDGAQGVDQLDKSQAIAMLAAAWAWALGNYSGGTSTPWGSPKGGDPSLSIGPPRPSSGAILPGPSGVPVAWIGQGQPAPAAPAGDAPASPALLLLFVLAFVLFLEE